MSPRKARKPDASPVEGREIIVGVSGGVAAYKTADLVSKLRQRGAGVTVVMTANAQQFVTPLTFESVSGNRVVTDLFDASRPFTYGHIALADKADLLVIAPATADVIGKIACGIADDALTTTAMSCDVPVIIAPAMNVRMFANAVLQENLAKLKKLGATIVGPDEGWLACGTRGKGRMAEVPAILDAIESALS